MVNVVPILFLILVVLKLAGLIVISWWIITMPVWLPFALLPWVFLLLIVVKCWKP